MKLNQAITTGYFRVVEPTNIKTKKRKVKVKILNKRKFKQLKQHLFK